MILETAKQLCAKNFPIIPVAYKSKKPTLKDWPKLQIDASNCHDFFSEEPSNIAVLLGKPDSYLADLDIDHVEALPFAEIFAPKTDFVFGRPAKPKSHYMYSVQEQEVQPVVFKHPKFGCLVEIRGEGQATVMPGSVHYSGELITYDTEGNVGKVSYADLKKKAALIAVCTVFCLEGIASGSRHNAALGISGLLCKAGIAGADVVKAVHMIAKTCGDEEIEDRKKAARDTVIRFQKGLSVSGASSLDGVFSLETMKQVRLWLNCSVQQEIPDLMDMLNQQYALVMVGGKAKILDLKAFEESAGSPFLQVDSFKTLLKKNKVLVGLKKNNQPILKSHADIWLEHEDRRTYTDVIFDPSEAEPGRAFNFWRGFNVAPDLTTSCDLFLEHLEQVICAGNQEYFCWLQAWLADIVQNPGEKPGTAIAIRGAQGTGKSTVGLYFGKILGRHYLTLNNPRHAMGNFNAHLSAKLLVMLEEAFWAGDKAHEGVLKDLITSDHMLIEYKGVDAVKAKNCMRMIATSNNAWVIPAAMDDRRFFVLSALDKYAKNVDYFGKLHEERENGGPNKLLAYLQNLDISGVDLRNPPQTEALVEQKIQSLDLVGKFLYSCLTRGTIYPEGIFWPEHVETAHVFSYYKSFAKQTHLPDRNCDTSFGMRLRNYFPDIQKVTKLIDAQDVETGADLALMYGNKKKRQVYLLPPLKEARDIFTACTGIPVIEPPEV